MKNLIWYIGTFIVVYLFYLVFVMCRKKVLKKMVNGKEMSYLKYKYKVKITDNNLKRIANSVFLANSFILSTTAYIVLLIDSFWLELLVGTIVIAALIYICYFIIGKHYSTGKEK